MKAIAITRPGGPEVLELVERPDPTPGPQECLVRVSASGINRPDVLQRKGVYPPPAGASELPGLEVAGEIVAGDAEALAAHGFKLGDEVCALVNGGGYAELCTVPVGQCLPAPKGWTLTQAAALPETCFTVWANLFDRVSLQAGETLLVHGGASGIGVTALQIAKALGARVIVTVGSADKAAACKALGADVVVNHREQDFVAEAMAATEGRGVDVILDMVAGDYIGRGVQALAEDGRIAVIAVQGGVKAEVDAGLVLRKRLTITGSTLRPRPAAFKAQLARSVREKVWPLIEAGHVKPVIFRELPAARAAEAHALMESNQHIGKIVLTWRS